MYTVSVKQDFIAQHKLIGGDWGSENYPHSHHYVLEVAIEHDELDQHGYLVDILDLESALKKEVDYFKDRLLNDLSEFEGLNPSLEHFARIVWERLVAELALHGRGTLTIRLWENDNCWAAYRHAC